MKRNNERILGPYDQGEKGWRVVEIDAAGTRTSSMFPTEAKARRYIVMLGNAIMDHARETERLGPFDLQRLELSGFNAGDQHTYVIEGVGTGLVKIGKTGDIKKRLAAMRTGSPTELRLVAWLAGDIESSLHTMLAAHRVHGEWFTYVPEVDRLIGLLDKVPQRWSP